MGNCFCITLLQCCEGGLSECLQLVCDIPRAGAKETDIFGRLLLHRVCEHKAPVEVVDALLAAYPDGKPIESVLFVELC